MQLKESRSGSLFACQEIQEQRFQLYLKIVCSKSKSKTIFGIIFKKHWKRDAL
ncbi:hypothetical protein HMPREF9425_0893 [Streptococcus vestibularis ATCC 49124]|uniref:Uncharacterized protein n=1 Tax=Streptococcus vestibularis ATCC 49124 TaxID=889206 RepID=A0ABN0CGU8_STRVE|nr:hypothetical protein HMPREF9425_0893 [Streptococcus vestibularis ATCC 49124]